MGVLTATLPNGTTHRWSSDDPKRINRFLERFREHILQHVRNDPEIAPQLVNRSDDEAVADYCWGMACHVMTTPVQEQAAEWRGMFLTYFLLTSASIDPAYPGRYADWLTDHNVEIRVFSARPAAGVDMEVRITSDLAPTAVDAAGGGGHD
jgi:hypothetical protein